MNIPTPYYKIDIDKLSENINGPIKKLREEVNCKVLIALKGFSVPSVLSIIADGLDGVSASGLYESALGKNVIGKDVYTYSPAFKDDEIEEIAENSSVVIFNSVTQFEKYHRTVYQHHTSCGIRVNPECSTLPETFRANPCQTSSRLGVTFENMPDVDMFGERKIEGIHIHTMCEQNADALRCNIDNLKNKYDAYLRRIKWINLGGGQLYAKDYYDLNETIRALKDLRHIYGFDIILEPCTGIVADSGFFITTVIDIVHNGIDIAIIDGSAICHIPDAAYIGWKRNIEGASGSDDFPYHYRIAGCSCYAADVWGDYSFSKPLAVGDQIVFKDAAMYSIVKGNFFNGLKMPSVVIYSKKNGSEIIKSYDYNTFLSLQ